jgi:preprotein translocase subunit Sec63
LLLGFLIGLSVIAYQTAKTSDTVLKGFDPYELLGVDYNTELPQIKKAYR